MLKIDRSGYEHFFALLCMFTLKKNERKAKPFQSDTWNSEETDVGRVNWCDNTSLDTGMAMNTITDLDNLVLDVSPNQQRAHHTSRGACSVVPLVEYNASIIASNSLELVEQFREIKE